MKKIPKLYRRTKAVLLLQLCQIKFPTLQRGAGENTTNNYLAVTWNSPPKDGKLHRHCAKDRKLSTGIQPYRALSALKGKLLPPGVLIPTLQTTIWKRYLISERTHLLLLLVLTKPLKKPQQLQNCKHNVPRKMIWQASIDRFLQLLWNALFKIIPFNCKEKQFYCLTIGFWTQIPLAHHRHWNMLPSYSEIERRQAFPSRETNVPPIPQTQCSELTCACTTLLHIRSLSSSLDQLKSSRQTSAVHTSTAVH